VTLPGGIAGGAGPIGLARTVINAWALLGGVLLVLVVLVNVVAIVGAVFGWPFPGDFELTEVGVAVAVFAFLPYCQLTYSNVTADIFTSWLSERPVAVLSIIASFVALAFSGFLLSRMYYGMLDQMAYGYTTAILQIPHWVAFVPILISLALLAVAAAITALETYQTIKRA
jgi:TRAP-type C4-dicarboxylate transport system permease small subunit